MTDRDRRTLVIGVVAGLLLLGGFFALLGLEPPSRTDECGPLPGLASKIRWLLSVVVAVVIVVIGGIVTLLQRDRRVILAALVIAPAAPIGLGIGLALSGDPC